MAAKDLGNKFLCFKCGAKFYDLKRPDPVCPKCGSDQREKPPEKVERKRAAKVAVPEPEVEQETLEDEELDADEDVEAPGDEEDL